ncbi:MAG: hypothetical protein D6765_09365 [Bacteroidetes bacterium]|nr:MAG: hypothetical protein D6765_09365 [Bacteroidota bacterium]
MWHRLLPLGLFVFLALSTRAQVPDSLYHTLPPNLLPPPPPDSAHTDSLPPEPRMGFFYRVWKKDYPSPKKALFLSLAVPGAGQLYNKRWWKVPLVYGGLAGMVYLVDRNSTQYKRFQQAYLAALKGEPHEFGSALDAGDLLRLRNTADKNRQLSYIGLFAVYLFQATEALVDAHLRSFDVSDDLSARFQPALLPAPDGPLAPGIGLVLRFE